MSPSSSAGRAISEGRNLAERANRAAGSTGRYRRRARGSGSKGGSEGGVVVTHKTTGLNKAWFVIALPGVLLLSCQTGVRHEPVRETWMDPDASVPIIDIGIAKPRVMSNREVLLSPIMREAARRVLLDEK